MANNAVGVRGFLSYARKDNDQFENVADKIKEQLEGRFAATTGRELELFLDRDSIGWGADWRARIRDSVKTATFFLPIITMRYFDSDACREELLAFYENANQLGVTELLLPIVLTGADQITDADPREEVRLVESLNYKNIEEAWISGYGSSQWNRAIHEMVLELKRGLSVAENALEEQEATPVVRTAGAPLGDQSDEPPADVLALSSDLTDVTQVVNDANAAMTEFGTATSSSMGSLDLSSMPPAQQQASLLRVAHVLREPAAKLGSTGAELERRIGAMDVRLRSVVEELRSIDAAMAQEQLDKLLAGFAAAQELGTVVEQMNEFVQILRFAAVMNVSLRKSLQPAIQGVQSIGNAVSTFESWKSI